MTPVPSRVLAAAAALLCFGLVLGRAGSAAAQKGPERVFAGKIMVSDHVFPSHAKSVNAYIAKIRQNTKTQLWEDKAKGTWKVFFAAFTKKPLNDIEVIVKLYDVSNGSRTMLASFEQYLDQRGENALLSSFTLDRKQVGVNKQVYMQLEVQGRVVATGSFKILGQAEKLTGKVEFTDDDTKKDDDGDE